MTDFKFSLHLLSHVELRQPRASLKGLKGLGTPPILSGGFYKHSRGTFLRSLLCSRWVWTATFCSLALHRSTCALWGQTFVLLNLWGNRGYVACLVHTLGRAAKLTLTTGSNKKTLNHHTRRFNPDAVVKQDKCFSSGVLKRKPLLNSVLTAVIMMNQLN